MNMKKITAVLLLFMATAFLYAGNHTNLGTEISFDFGACTLEEVSEFYEELLDILGDEYELEKRSDVSKRSYFHKTARWTSCNYSYRLNGGDCAILIDFYAAQKCPFPYVRKDSVKGNITFCEFFVLLNERPSAYYVFQRNVMFKIMAFAKKNDINVTGFERTNFIFNSGPLPYSGQEIHFDFGRRTSEEARKFYEELAETLSLKYMLVYKELDFRGNYSYLFSNGWDMKSIQLHFSPENDTPLENISVYLILYKDHTESPPEILAAYRDFQKGLLLAIKSFAEEHNVKIASYSSGKSDLKMDFFAGASE